MENPTDLFDEIQGQKVVNALMLGQRRYIDERLEKQRTMAVSDGYAWTRSNHIDDAFAKSEMFPYQLKRAGQAWGYLEFKADAEQYGNVLLIIKGKKRIESKFSEVQKSGTGYLFEYATINTPYLKRAGLVDQTDSSVLLGVQMELISDDMIQEIEEATSQSNIDNFFILTHEADSENNIVSVQVYMPDARNGKLHPIQDLSEYIANSPYTLANETYQNLPNFSELTETEEFGIIPGTAEQEQEN
ncbi:hypothetical protein Q8F60_07440 [Streptococcus constellatus]|jgi:hypothetical protein|uniref:Uncharacterized protein n=1 Tax=Streptococcus constellatus subsp. constellatus SK53 TaxID=1095730 RepID=A0AAD2Y3S9_STRCV|nr:hypothetical protein [Streptococcus constellatus]EID18655.1 hypothetical protein HMPREF1044_1467 [Streptococcus constellatus subsp. constellatus SK53]MDP1485889.1 hypothetical protein [Streptococcus constellatus]QQT05334.1 hypothetical protein I6J13_08090 [Streptococcus constellatus]SUN39849.1 Uncharacterised protein [Streptococcus constellatus]BBD21899.1 hypothetical protein SCSC_0213 [Streptococcus constellatus subsp. constellatus]